jgi:hypothetical protein
MEEEAQRGLAYLGSGNRLRRVAHKLLGGKPIQVFMLGGSVTVGASWARLAFDALNASFPNRQECCASTKGRQGWPACQLGVSTSSQAWPCPLFTL